MPNPWVSHCKAYQKKHGCSYGEAMKKAKTSYKKNKGVKGGRPNLKAAFRGFKQGLRWFKKSPQFKIAKKAFQYGNVAVRAAFNTNPKARGPYLGEMHGVELSGPYKFSSMNYLGPFTKVARRLREGHQPVNQPDAYAKVHDTEYLQMKQRPKSEWRARIIASDEKFLEGMIASWNYPEARIAYAAILAKLTAQKAGRLPWSAFIERA